MRFQALLLSLIILTSFLITGINSPEKSSAEENLTSEPVDTSPSLFVKDFYFVAKEKTVLASSNLIEGINQNAAFLKQTVSINLNNFLSKLKSEDNSDNSISSADKTALISEAKIDLLPPVCDSKILQLNVKAALVKYLDYNSNIFEFNPENRWPIASLTKLMTGVIAMKKMDLDKKIIMTEKAVATEGTAGDFKTGEVYKISDLIKAMLISSSNDAAVAIIEDFGEKGFIDEMQKKAAELKMFQTSFLEPTGLSFINQSTANDLTKLMNYIYQNHPELLEISRQREVEIFELKSKKAIKLLTVNRFAGQPDFIGGKTGYIEEAGRNLIALFNINGKIILSIVLGADDSFKETEKLKKMVQDCQ